MDRAEQIRENYLEVLARIAKAAQRAGREPADIRLVVVTKSHPVEAAWAAAVAGAQHLGENYAEEGAGKQAERTWPAGITWHMIGHVQSRKAGLVCAHYGYLHSLDSLKLANRLERCAEERGQRLPVLLECNVSGESTKSGWPAWNLADWPALLLELRQIVTLPHLQVRGLMTMAPFLPEPEQARPYFRRLRQLQAFLRQELPQVDWAELSMGMSADFEAAIEEGATWVRVGQAILGPREPAG
jgi:hypothetical protein